MRRPPQPGPSRRLRTLLPVHVALLGALALGGCGDADEQPPAAPAAVRRWNVLPAPPAEQARFALERLIRGPVPQTVLPIPDQHKQILRTAKRDLVALPLETLALLGDPALCERLTGPATLDLNPWHNVLEVLSSLPQPDAALVRRWVEPALLREEPSLWMLAAGCLVSAAAEPLAPLGLTLLERGAHDRQVSRETFRFLARLPAPWPQRAAAVVQATGSPFTWLLVADTLAATRGVPDSGTAPADALAWWALLAEQSGPRPPGGLPRLKVLPYAETLLQTHLPSGEAPRAWPLPARLLDDRGWFSVDLTDVAELPLLALFSTGQEPAAQARCALARGGWAPGVAALKADRSGSDPLRRLHAEHCMLEGESGVPIEALVDGTQAFLATLRSARAQPWSLAAVQGVRVGLPPATTPQAVAVLQRVLQEARPAGDLMLVIESAHDLLRAPGRGEDESAVLRLLASEHPEDRAVGAHLAQRARKGVYLEPLLARQAAAPPDERRALERPLHWIVTGGDVPPAALASYVRHYLTLLDEATDELLPPLATGLLDLGDLGVAALVERLRGARGPLYARAMVEAGNVLPVSVAEALCDQIDMRRTAQARHDLYIAIWRGAPAEATGALAAARSRLEPAERPVIDVLLEVVRHRAARARL